MTWLGKTAAWFGEIVLMLRDVKKPVCPLQLRRIALLKSRGVERVDIFRHSEVDRPDSIFMSTGDMAVPYCKARIGAVRTSYVDGSCLYPEVGDLVVTFDDGHREIF